VLTGVDALVLSGAIEPIGPQDEEWAVVERPRARVERLGEGGAVVRARDERVGWC
jgi:hypothetical protein